MFVPIKIAYSKLGMKGTVSGSIERVKINNEDSLVAYVTIHDDVDSTSTVYMTSFNNADFDEFIIRLKHSIIKHSFRQFGKHIYETELKVFGLTSNFVDDLHLAMTNQIGMPAYDKGRLNILVRELTKHFFN